MTTTGTAWSVSGTNTKVRILNGGTLTETVSSISLSANTSLQVDDGGNLNHNVNTLTVFSGTVTFGNTSTVNYGFAGAQTIYSTAYGNLTLSGSGVKTLPPGITVSGTLSMEGTATASGTTPTYGASATIQYKGTSAQVTGIELPSTFNGTGGIIINNSTGVSLTTSLAITYTLTTSRYLCCRSKHSDFKRTNYCRNTFKSVNNIIIQSRIWRYICRCFNTNQCYCFKWPFNNQYQYCYFAKLPYCQRNI